MRKWIAQGLTPILCALTLLLGVIAAGRAARASLHDRSAYTLAFEDIDCQPPEGMSRTAFLSEVRELTRQPARLRLLDEDLTSRLHRAFLAHPWVESVRLVAIDPSKHLGSSSCRSISVHIEPEYRRPVLAVSQSPDKSGNGKPKAESGWRMVDRQGILLPGTSARSHLPVLTGDITAPAGPPGSHWGDARVTAAVRTVAFLQSHLARLHLEDSQIEVIEGEIVFRLPGTRIVWGHAPGHEKEDEAPAKIKLKRLLDYQVEHDGLESLEHDVRLLAYQGHFPLTPDKAPNAVSLYESSQSPSKSNRDQLSNTSRSWRSCFNDAISPSASASSR
jgi:hypothetical protein